MLITCYLASAILFYWFVAKRAPLMDEPALAYAGPAAQGEVIELFGNPASEVESKAA